MDNNPEQPRPQPGSLSQLFDRIRAGDRAAREKLAAALYDRTVRLTAAMLRGFPVLQQRRTAASLAQDLWVRLLQALDAGVSTQTTAEFLRLAAIRLRQLLVDEADRHRGREAATRRRHPHGDGRMVELGQLEHPEGGGGFDPAAPASDDPTRLAEWVEFHEQVARLPADERAAVELRFYAGVANKEAAEAMGMTEKQASRLWIAACQKIAKHMPQID